MDIGVVRELAVALKREDLLGIVEEYETHARIEIEQIFRYNVIRNAAEVKSIAHRLAGTSINLGLVKFSNAMRAIEASPEQKIKDPAELEQMLEKSIHWLQHYLTQIFQDIAV
jgi:HPt (histidine-containing phosphotransfer) domain-containing protein